MSDYVKVPSHDGDMELFVIAAMAFDNDFIPQAAGILQPEDFYRPDNRAVYEAALKLHANGEPVTLVTLKAELETQGLFDRIGGGGYLADLARMICSSVDAAYYAQRVRQLSESRQIAKSVQDMLGKNELLAADDLRKALEKAESKQYVKSYADKSIGNIDTFKKNLRVKKDRVYTGFNILDRLTGGIRIPCMAAIGAYPSVGKTAFALNVAMAQTGPVIFFSLEMSNDMIYERLASAQLKINYRLFSSQELDDSQYAQTEAFAEKLKESRFHVFDDVYFIEQQLNIVAGIKPTLVIVDYVQKVKTHHKADGRRLEIDYISGMYKRMASANNCVVMILSQLARPGSINKPETFKPTMSYLKESGSLEADSDYVGILHRPYVMCKDNPGEVKPEDGYILIDKNKFGNTGQIDLFFDGRYQKFYEVEKKRSYSQPVPKDFFAETLPADVELPFQV